MKNFQKVFVVTADVNHYEMVQETALELTMQSTTNNIIAFHGEPKTNWEPVAIDWLKVPGEKALPLPDIAAFGSTALAVSDDTASILRPALDDSCQLLPLDLSGQKWLALNITLKYDAIDEDLTERKMRHGRPDRVRPFKRLVFKSSPISTSGLFRVNGVGLAMYCTDVEGGFFDLVQKHGLTGIDFDEVEIS